MTTIADALRAGIELLSATRETFAAEVMLRQYDDVLEKLRAALQAAERNAEMLEAARELLALKEELEHPQPPRAQADAIEALRMALDALSCTGDPDDPGHRCGHCDEYVDRNEVVRKRIRALLAETAR